jgi:hypothetical protein
MPFILGDANTGKSSILDIVERWFPPMVVGTMDSSKCEKFGLENLHDKLVVFFRDLEQGFKRSLPQAIWQSMITGEDININVKFKTPLIKKWQIPMIGCGNVLFDYNDTSGSASRRLAVFRFLKLVQNRDTQLVQKIVSNELITIMLRCMVKYRNLAEENKGMDFWKEIAPDCMVETKNEVAEETNHIANFLANGDDYYQIIHDSGSVTTLKDFERAFKNHMRIHHSEAKVTLSQNDFFPFKVAGFVNEVKNLCKACKFPHKKSCCEGHVAGDRGRFKRVVLRNMRIQDLKCAMP